jgi:hypothetical protein
MTEEELFKTPASAVTVETPRTPIWSPPPSLHGAKLAYAHG